MDKTTDQLDQDGTRPLLKEGPRTEAASESLREAQHRFAESGRKSPKNWVLGGLIATGSFFLISLFRRNWTLTRIAMGFFIALLGKLQDSLLADRMLKKREEARINAGEEPGDVVFESKNHLDV